MKDRKSVGVDVETGKIMEQESVDKKATWKQIQVFVGIVYGLSLVTTFILGILSHAMGNSFQTTMMVVGALFMYTPLLAAMITRKLMKEKSSPLQYARPHIKGNGRYYLAACFMPGALILLGVVIYFLIFPSHLDWSMPYMVDAMNKTGQKVVIPTFTVPMIIGICLLIVLGPPLVIINHLFAFGEEAGWRGYLLPRLLKVMTPVKAILVSGVIWGGWHFPLLLFGHNYGTDCWGYPIMPIIVMIFFTTAIGILISYLFIKTQSIIPCSITHGAINAVGTVGILVTTDANYLLGPNVSGVLGCSGFVMVGIYLLYQLTKTNSYSMDEPIEKY